MKSSTKIFAACMSMSSALSAEAATAKDKETAAKPTPKVEKVNCYGTNSCKGKSACAVSKEDIEATKSVFKDKFAKSAVQSCHGFDTNNPSQLNYVMLSKEECAEKSGFLIQKKDGKRTVVVLKK